jgi:hypothetical protein
MAEGQCRLVLTSSHSRPALPAHTCLPVSLLGVSSSQPQRSYDSSMRSARRTLCSMRAAWAPAHTQQGVAHVRLSAWGLHFIMKQLQELDTSAVCRTDEHYDPQRLHTAVRHHSLIQITIVADVVVDPCAAQRCMPSQSRHIGRRVTKRLTNSWRAHPIHVLPHRHSYHTLHAHPKPPRPTDTIPQSRPVASPTLACSPGK